MHTFSASPAGLGRTHASEEVLDYFALSRRALPKASAYVTNRKSALRSHNGGFGETTLSPWAHVQQAARLIQV